jgi:UDP-3-O-[3-hydroxymyristoyl] glucosamine N-acyltransferase
MANAHVTLSPLHLVTLSSSTPMPTINLGQIVELLKCPPLALGALTAVTGVAALEDAGPTELSLLTSEQYLKQFVATRAAAVLVDKKVKLRPDAPPAAVLWVDDAELAMARVLELFAPPVSRPPAGVDKTAQVDPTVQVSDGVAIGPLTVVGARCRIGRGTVIHASVFLGDDVVIGEQCEIFPHVTIRQRISIGHRVTIHANSVLGTDGFGYRWDGSRHVKVPQIGTVVIEDDVEIGSCVCIDRAKFGVTRIGRGTKIDNLVQIGHNVTIGPHCIIVGQAGLAGSAKLGAGVVLGGQTAVRDHITIGDGAMAAACSGIAEDVEPGAIVSGTPALPHRQSLREQAALRRLPDLVVQVRKLTEKQEK